MLCHSYGACIQAPMPAAQSKSLPHDFRLPTLSGESR